MTTIDSTYILQVALYGLMAVVLIVSSLTDLYHRRIPNLVTLPCILITLLSYTFIGGMDGFLFSLTGLGVGFLIFVLPYLTGGMGAGDVKLMSAVGAVLGFSYTLLSLLFIAISGGILALALIIYRRTFKQTMSQIFGSFLYLVAHREISTLKVEKTTLTQEGIPFAIAITTGVFLLFIYLFANDMALSTFVAPSITQHSDPIA